MLRHATVRALVEVFYTDRGSAAKLSTHASFISKVRLRPGELRKMSDDEWFRTELFEYGFWVFMATAAGLAIACSAIFAYGFL